MFIYSLIAPALMVWDFIPMQMFNIQITACITNNNRNGLANWWYFWRLRMTSLVQASAEWPRTRWSDQNVYGVGHKRTMSNRRRQPFPTGGTKLFTVLMESLKTTESVIINKFITYFRARHQGSCNIYSSSVSGQPQWSNLGVANWESNYLK